MCSGWHPRKLSYPLLTGVALVSVGFAGAAYPPEEETDREYALDLVQLYFDRDWEAIWERTDNGVRLSMGSLNVRQWFVYQEVKLAAAFTSRLAFKYNYYRREGLEPLWDERQKNEFGFEGRPFGKLWLGLYTTPAFWKREADAAFVGAWREQGRRWLEVRFTAVDFDNNYSFRRSGYDEGYEEIFQQPARRYEIAAGWIWPFGLSARGSAFVRAPAVKVYDYFYGQRPDWSRRFAERSVAGELWQTFTPVWEVYVSGRTERWEEDVLPAEKTAAMVPPEEYYRGTIFLTTAGGGLYFQPPGRHRVRAGLETRRQTRRFNFPFNNWESHEYAKNELVYFLLWRLRTWRELYLETGYAGQRSATEKTYVASRWHEAKTLYDNRIPISLEYKFGEAYGFKLSSGIDLDKRDWGQYLIYDKAQAQAIACF